MRNKRLMIVALGATLALGVAASAIGATAVQTLDVITGGKSTPKLDKKKFTPSSIDVTTTVSDGSNPSAIPPKATQAVLKFDKKDLKFNPKAVPGCHASQIENTTTEVAKAACGSSVIGSGSAMVALPLGAGGTRQDFPAVVTAFNNGDAKGILLHSRVGAPLNTTVVLKGTLSGATLTVQIPPLAGGVGAIPQFRVKVKKKDYVQARCADKKIDTSSTFTYSDAPTATATDSQKCKQKKS
jgi:hypothetical protein